MRNYLLTVSPQIKLITSERGLYRGGRGDSVYGENYYARQSILKDKTLCSNK